MAQAPVAEEKVKEEQKVTDPNKSIVSNCRYYSFIRCKYTKKRHAITLKEISTLFKSAKDSASLLEIIYCKDVLQYVESNINQTITLSPNEWEFEFCLSKFCQQSSSDANVEGS